MYKTRIITLESSLFLAKQKSLAGPVINLVLSSISLLATPSYKHETIGYVLDMVDSPAVLRCSTLMSWRFTTWLRHQHTVA